MTDSIGDGSRRRCMYVWCDVYVSLFVKVIVIVIATTCIVVLCIINKQNIIKINVKNKSSIEILRLSEVIQLAAAIQQVTYQAVLTNTIITIKTYNIYISLNWALATLLIIVSSLVAYLAFCALLDSYILAALLRVACMCAINTTNIIRVRT